jgi:hypothetical protein
MNVIALLPAGGGLRFWTATELERLVGLYKSYARDADATSWDVGATELDDPQFYVIGPAPECDCLVTVSRVGRIYVAEDGGGHVLAEGVSLESVASAAEAGRKAPGLITSILVGLTAIRVTIQERLEPVLVESEEFFLRIGPQLAALV